MDLKAHQLQRYQKANSGTVNYEVKIQTLLTLSQKCFQKTPCTAKLYKGSDHHSVSSLTEYGPHSTSDGETSHLLTSNEFRLETDSELITAANEVITSGSTSVSGPVCQGTVTDSTATGTEQLVPIPAALQPIKVV